MTKLERQSETCYVCGHISEQTVIVSTGAYFAPDLDNRPSMLARSTMPYWVEKCPSCGYCARYLSEGSPSGKQITQGEAYQQQLKAPYYPELANRFLCAAMIYEHLQDYQQAGHNSLNAAWACDDNEAIEPARQCRRKAIQLFQKAEANRAPLVEDIGLAEAIIADLLRRIGQFDEAKRISEEGLKRLPEEDIADMLKAQLFFVSKQDTQRYDLDTAKELMERSTSANQE